MNILIIAQSDWTGAGAALARAINEHTGHHARAVCFKHWYLDYPKDVLSPTMGELTELANWADIWNLHDDYQMPDGVSPRPVITTYHGSWYRRDWRKVNEAARSLGYTQTVLTPDLTACGPLWIGRPMRDLSGMYDPGDTGMFRVIHTPTGRDKKGTQYILDALNDLDGVSLEIVENVTNEECLRRKSRAHLLIDQIQGLGYGTSALESWAMNVPVISGTFVGNLRSIQREVGYVPFCQATPDTLRGIVEKFRDDPKFYEHWQEVGSRYVREWHDPRMVAERFIGTCEVVMNPTSRITRIESPSCRAYVTVKSETEHLQSWWRSNKFYESEMLEYIQRKYHGGTFIDVGSAIGNHALFFAKCCDSRVLSVEPVHSSIHHQELNLVLSGVMNKVSLHNVALSDSPGRGVMRLPADDNLGMAQLVKGDDVVITTLDALVESEDLGDVTLVKIDAEGCELPILRGAHRLLTEQKPALFVEMGDKQTEIVDYLESLGYHRGPRFNNSPTWEFTVNPPGSPGSPKISVCMIVKNEESVLSHAIESVEGLADEVIIVDTGSEDDTVNLARDLGCRVITGGDHMHKGESRNRALDESTGDWEIVLDADERIADPVGLRNWLLTTDRDAAYVRLTYMNNDTPGMAFSQLRCWRRGLFRYRYRAHEIPVYTQSGNCPTAWTEFIWEHRPPPGRGTRKLQYTLDRLELDLKEYPDDPRVVYYYARQLRYLGEYTKALVSLEHYLEITKPTGGWDRTNAYQDIAVCHRELKDQPKQVEALFSACRESPMNRTPWCTLASIYYEAGRNETAAGLLRCALEIPRDKTIGYLEPKWHGQWIHDILARCYWRLERYEQGVEQARIALSLEPNNERLKKNLGFFERKLNVLA